MKQRLKPLLIIISVVGLLLTIVPSVLKFKGLVDMQDHYHMMLAGTILWFVTAPFWMETKSLDDGE